MFNGPTKSNTQIKLKQNNTVPYNTVKQNCT